MSANKMAARQLLCAYCGKEGTRQEMNKEHFVPRCLWERQRPNRTLTVMVHTACNAEYSRDDEYFRTAIVAINGTEHHPEASSVQQGTLSRLIRERPGLIKQHLPNLDYGAIESPSGLLLGNVMTFRLDVRRFFRILRKVVLGLYYCKIGSPLPFDYDVVPLWENAQTRPMVEPIFPFMHPVADFGDDVFIYRWMSFPGDDRRTLWCLGFYKAVSFFAATLPKSDLPDKGGPLHFMNVSPASVYQRG